MEGWRATPASYRHTSAKQGGGQGSAKEKEQLCVPSQRVPRGRELARGNTAPRAERLPRPQPPSGTPCIARRRFAWRFCWPARFVLWFPGFRDRGGLGCQGIETGLTALPVQRSAGWWLRLCRFCETGVVSLVGFPSKPCPVVTQRAWPHAAATGIRLTPRVRYGILKAPEIWH